MRYFGEFWNALGVLVTGPDWDSKSSRENWLSHSLYQNWNLKSKQWCYWICSLCHMKGNSHDARRGCTHLSHSCTSRPLHWKQCHVWQPSEHARKEVLLQVKIVNKKRKKQVHFVPHISVVLQTSLQFSSGSQTGPFEELVCAIGPHVWCS